MATVIKNLWPDDVKSNEVLSPEQILRSQGEYLKQGTAGAVDAIVSQDILEGRVIITFDLSSAVKRVRILSAQHQPEFEYPVLISPPDFTVPGYLQKRVNTEGRLEPPPVVKKLVEPYTRDQWLCESPVEFMEKVEMVLKSGPVKSIVLSLIANATRDKKAK